MSSAALAAFLKPLIAPVMLGTLFGVAAFGAWLVRRLPDSRLKRLLLLRVGRSGKQVGKRSPQTFQRGRTL